MFLFAAPGVELGVDVPVEYRDREQTFFKHQVLRQYLRAWSQKLASTSQRGVAVRLWYVDCFAGPWESRTDDRADTSVAIGLSALEDALDTWSVEKGLRVQAGAIFVEANPSSAQNLRTYLASRPNRGVTPSVLQGEFGGQVGEIKKLIANDAAFVFVDPTGWKGAGMGHITPLLGGRFRDVMINVMFHHLNRWKDDRREFLREQMRDFFGLGEADLPPRLDEAALMSLYRQQLKSHARLEHVADLAVPHPSVDRTFFRLVVGGRHPEVLRLFRDVEEKVVGKDAGAVRERMRTRKTEEETGQLALPTLPTVDRRYQRMRNADLPEAMSTLVRRLAERGGSAKFDSLWPELLAEYHITHKHLASAVLAEVNAGTLSVKGMRERERTIKDEHVIVSLPGAPVLS